MLLKDFMPYTVLKAEAQDPKQAASGPHGDLRASVGLAGILGAALSGDTF